MIYEIVEPTHLQQGDILKDIPKITPHQINFNQLKTFWDENLQKDSLPELGRFDVRPILSNGVILSQTCDIRPGFSILFAELKDLPPNKLSPNPKKRFRGIKRILRDETRAHYFPPDENIELFEEAKLLDFKSLFFLPYEFFEKNLQIYFVVRLKDEALAVLTDKISNFFTRLAYEDLMFLSGEELTHYLESLSEEERNSAQKSIESLRM